MSSDLKRWEVRLEETVTAADITYVDADSKEQAEDIARDSIYDSGDAFREVLDSEVTAEARELDPGHDVAPVSYGALTLCKKCERPAEWTGTNAKDSPTGETIPGPWVHVDRDKDAPSAKRRRFLVEIDAPVDLDIDDFVQMLDDDLTRMLHDAKELDP